MSTFPKLKLYLEPHFAQLPLQPPAFTSDEKQRGQRRDVNSLIILPQVGHIIHSVFFPSFRSQHLFCISFPLTRLLSFSFGEFTYNDCTSQNCQDKTYNTICRTDKFVSLVDNPANKEGNNHN